MRSIDFVQPSNRNQRTLLELKIELEVLQSTSPKTPEEQRSLTEQIVHTGDLIALIEYVEMGQAS